MIFESIGRAGEFISAVSLGAEHLERADAKTTDDVVSAAIDVGINYIDLFMATPAVRDNIGKSLAGRRDKVMLAGHLGAALDASGQYMRTRDERQSVRHLDDFLRRTRSDAADVLMLHFVDEEDDARAVFGPGGLCEIAYRLKKEGKARMIGMSSHVAQAAQYAVDSGMLDVLMFPVNPIHDTSDAGTIDELFDQSAEGEDAPGVSPAKARLYRSCLREKVGIVAMKPYAAGWLLSEHKNFPCLTPIQCVHYALSQPGVVSALCGCSTPEHVLAAAAYCDAADEQRDLSLLSGSARWKRPECMYCNHCLPCPVGIDIAETTRLADAADSGATDALRDRFLRLPTPPAECVACGNCTAQCPFGIDVVANMRRAAERFA